MEVLFLTLLLALSCTKNANVSKDSVSIQINPVQMKISHLNEVKWRVGLNKEKKISQSLTFIVDMPKVKDSDLSYLSEQKEIDSWILRLIVNRGSETQDLGSTYAMFKPNKIARSSLLVATPTSVTFKIFYSAAFASERFRTFKCPAFGHNKKIDDMNILGQNTEFSLNIGQTISYNEKSQPLELTPSSFNGGNSLIGEYYVEIAPYNSKKKFIYSSFKRIPMFISVTREESIRIPSCDGIHQELQ